MVAYGLLRSGRLGQAILVGPPASLEGFRVAPRVPNELLLVVFHVERRPGSAGESAGARAPLLGSRSVVIGLPGTVSVCRAADG